MSERRSLTLTESQWRQLEEVATVTESRAEAGPTYGEPSWRTLIRKIADGQLEVRLVEGIEVSIDGNWKMYWGGMPLPDGAQALGTVRRESGTGALIRLASGSYAQGNAGGIKTLPQGAVEQALARSQQ